MVCIYILYKHCIRLKRNCQISHIQWQRNIMISNFFFLLLVYIAGERFNWAEALRTRAERAPSLGSYPPTSPTTSGPQPASAPSPKQNHHQRAASIAIMEQPAKGSSQTNQQQAQKPKSKPKPDYFQEKILKADFMD